jgi:hypothetical protein
MTRRRRGKPKRYRLRPISPFVQAICKGDKVVAVRFPSPDCALSEKHWLEVGTDGRMTMLNHSRTTVDAFIAFGAAVPECLERLQGYEENPLGWFLDESHIWNSLTPENRAHLVIDIAEHVRPIYTSSPSVSPAGIKQAKHVISMARAHIDRTPMGHWPGFAFMVQEDAEGLRQYGVGKIEMDKVVEMPADSALTTIIMAAYAGAIPDLRQVSKTAVLRVALEAVHTVGRATGEAKTGLDVLKKVGARGSAMTQERFWQVSQMMKSLDGAKLCR